MADIILTKANPGFYYCYQENGGGYRKWGQYEVATLKWNDEGDAVWARSAGFTTGGYDVTHITVTINDMSPRDKGYDNPTVGIGTAIDNIPSFNTTPNVLWSKSDTANDVVNGHNQYSMDFDVDMKAGTTYYLYLYTWGKITTSNLGWQVFDHPSSSSDPRTSTVEITFNSKTVATPKYTLSLNAGTGTSRVTGEGSYESGSSITATATPMTGKTYTVKYNANGGTGTTASSTHTYGTPTALTTNGFSKTGYSFIGWNTAANGSDDFYSDKEFVSTLTTEDEIELYAQWSQATYRVAFDLQGGIVTSGNFDLKTYTTDAGYTLPTGTIIKSGYVFLGWSKTRTATSATYSNGQSGTDNLGISGATVTLYAIWRAKKFTIKYNANNGTTTNKSIQYTATNPNTISTLPSGWAKSGYSASGWSTLATATSPSYAFGDAFNDFEEIADGGTLNLYIVWTKNIPWKLTLIRAKINGIDYVL